MCNLCCDRVFFRSNISLLCVHVCVSVPSCEYVFCTCTLSDFFNVLCCVCVCTLRTCTFQCVSLYTAYSMYAHLSAFNAFGTPCTWCPRSDMCACVPPERVCIPSAAERPARPERPGVMSDARGGFLPTSPLAFWLTNGLLSGLADRLAGSQLLRLPYLVGEGGGWWRQGSGRGSTSALFTRRARRSERQSATEQTQIT